MNIDSKDFRVREGDEVDLSQWPTKVKPVYDSKKQYHMLLEDHVARLSAQQQLLYASDRYAVLLIFQAMDAAGLAGDEDLHMRGTGAVEAEFERGRTAVQRQHDRGGTTAHAPVRKRAA